MTTRPPEDDIQNDIHRHRMLRTSSECRVSELVNSDACSRPATCQVTRAGCQLGFLSEGSFFGEIPLISLSYPPLNLKCFEPPCVDFRKEVRKALGCLSCIHYSILDSTGAKDMRVLIFAEPGRGRGPGGRPAQPRLPGPPAPPRVQGAEARVRGARVRDPAADRAGGHRLRALLPDARHTAGTASEEGAALARKSGQL